MKARAKDTKNKLFFFCVGFIQIFLTYSKSFKVYFRICCAVFVVLLLLLIYKKVCLWKYYNSKFPKKRNSQLNFIKHYYCVILCVRFVVLNILIKVA